jgi:hypothetical protein
VTIAAYPTTTFPSLRRATRPAALTPDHGPAPCVGHEPESHVTPERSAWLQRQFGAWVPGFRARHPEFYSA